MEDFKLTRGYCCRLNDGSLDGCSDVCDLGWGDDASFAAIWWEQSFWASYRDGQRTQALDLYQLSYPGENAEG